MPLTKRQKQVLDFILSFEEENGYCPSFEEIASGLGLASLATVHKHISALEAKNYLRRVPRQSRSLELSPEYLADQKRTRDSRPSAPELPLTGRIAAGSPVEAFADKESLSFSEFLDEPEVFALEVRGDSMVEDHILSGDYVLVKRSHQPRNGEIVVALIDGQETTLKRYYRESESMVRLQPANAAMQPLRVPAECLKIQGVVLAVLRKYH